MSFARLPNLSPIEKFPSSHFFQAAPSNSYLYTTALSTPKDPTIRSARSQETTPYSKPQIKILPS